jgi:cholest-4-en-3-one 26-monooxygenase
MLAPHEIAPFFILLAVAGNDTTRTAISHGMHLLAQNPEQRKILQDDLEALLPTAVEEIVRVASPVTFMRRTATTDVTISGHNFSEGDKVVLLYGVANRDPRVFDDPETFDVRRDPNPHVGFGGTGAHYCIGANLARMTIDLIFNAVADHMPDLMPLSDPERLRSGWLNGIKHWQVDYTGKPAVAG